MFKRNKENFDGNYPYFQNQEIGRIFFELEEINRKLRNLNNRLKRVEKFLGLEENTSQNE